MEKRENGFSKWLHMNNVYSYYYQTRFTKAFDEMDVLPMDNGRAVVEYRGYPIMTLLCADKSILLVDYYQEFKEKLNIPQGKLYREYKRFFNMSLGHLYKPEMEKTEDEYVVTQYNEWHIIDYLENVRRKIDNGFEKYNIVVQERELTEKNSGFLQISVNNVFSFPELNALLDAYNELYALMYCAVKYGTTNVSPELLDKNRSRSLIVDSINIASPGIIVAVGEALVVELIKDTLISLFKGDLGIANEKRQKIEQEAARLSPETNRKIVELVEQLDFILEKKGKSSSVVCQNYLQIQAEALMKKIEELQGTTKIDMLV